MFKSSKPKSKKDDRKEYKQEPKDSYAYATYIRPYELAFPTTSSSSTSASTSKSTSFISSPRRWLQQQSIDKAEKRERDRREKNKEKEVTFQEMIQASKIHQWWGAEPLYDPVTLRKNESYYEWERKQLEQEKEEKRRNKKGWNSPEKESSRYFRDEQTYGARGTCAIQ